MFLATWKEIPPSNEIQSVISDVANLDPDYIQTRLEGCNVFTIARRSVDIGSVTQELIYLSLKLVNNIWVLGELKVTAGSTTVGVSVVASMIAVWLPLPPPPPACAEDCGSRCSGRSTGGLLGTAEELASFYIGSERNSRNARLLFTFILLLLTFRL